MLHFTWNTTRSVHTARLTDACAKKFGGFDVRVLVMHNLDDETSENNRFDVECQLRYNNTFAGESTLKLAEQSLICDTNDHDHALWLTLGTLLPDCALYAQHVLNNLCPDTPDNLYIERLVNEARLSFQTYGLKTAKEPVHA